jgi:hypothetical protein
MIQTTTPGGFPLRRHPAAQCFPFCILALIASLFFSVSVSATSPQYFYSKLVFPSRNRPSGMAIADVNGDGREDLIVSNTSDNSVSVFLGQMDGTFGSKTDFAAGTVPGYVKEIFNGDGKMGGGLKVPSRCPVRRRVRRSILTSSG